MLQFVKIVAKFLIEKRSSALHGTQFLWFNVNDFVRQAVHLPRSKLRNHHLLFFFLFFFCIFCIIVIFFQINIDL